MGQNGSENNKWVMGHYFDGSHGSWVTSCDPFAALNLAGTLKPTLIPWSIENAVPHYYRITSLFEGSYIKTLSTRRCQ